MKTSKIMILMAVLTMAWGCSSDDSDSNGGAKFIAGQKPDWHVDQTSSDEQPDWSKPDYSKYEYDMFMKVYLQDELAATSSDDDCMAVFVGDECRGMSNKRNGSENKGYYFLLRVYGNRADQQAPLTLSYYSAQQKQLFTLQSVDAFVPDCTLGFDSDFIPPLLSGSSKYPVQRQLTVTLRQNSLSTVMASDQVAVFVGDDCRGVGQVGTPFTIFARAEGEIMQVRYYSTDKGGIYTADSTITVGQQHINFLMTI